MSNIYITRPIPDAGAKMLQDKGHKVIVNELAEDRAATSDEVISALKQAKDGGKPFDAILAILTDKITSEVMDAGLPELKIIANYAVGFDNIDVKAAGEKNIMVTNTPGVLTDTVAEHTFALMLAIAHRIAEADRFARAGKYHAWGPKLLLGTDLSGKTLGVVGLGRIGSLVAEHGYKGFGMKVVYTDLNPNPDFEKQAGAVYFKELDEMLPQCDFVSIHVPLLDSTKHLINEERLKKMKPSAYLVNTSRGPIVDEKALAKALFSGTIRGAAIDVFENEPDITPELKEMEYIILTPHIASATEETRNKMAELAAQNIIDALDGKQPQNLVTSQ